MKQKIRENIGELDQTIESTFLKNDGGRCLTYFFKEIKLMFSVH